MKPSSLGFEIGCARPPSTHPARTHSRPRQHGRPSRHTTQARQTSTVAHGSTADRHDRPQQHGRPARQTTAARHTNTAEPTRQNSAADQHNDLIVSVLVVCATFLSFSDVLNHAFSDKLREQSCASRSCPVRLHNIEGWRIPENGDFT